MDSVKTRSTMKAVVYFVALMLGSAWSDMAGECDMAGFYMELGCTPLPRPDNSTACPDAFQCPDLHPDPSMCYYRGVPYGDRSTIPQALINNPCSQACRCTVAGEPRFECAALDCVEVFNGDLQQCVRTYELESCCSTGNVCGKDAIASLKTCEVDGKTYMEGESFEPKNSHKTCICTGEWNGTTDNAAYCRDINCGIEIHYQEKLLDNCAPVFVGDRRRCPIGFTCPSATTRVVRGLNVRGVNSECVFGNRTLSVGDEVTADACTTCACDVPPFVSCMMKNPCPNST
ncbi:uncharacterized protein LOC135076792 [Ostrinia nubilalis]|uniref:uncharacterized protein LOC135076792 n=1 Tax=Ostrinia nubilalis TaxID=29057 RepID=UPI0030825D84